MPGSTSNSPQRRIKTHSEETRSSHVKTNKTRVGSEEFSGIASSKNSKLRKPPTGVVEPKLVQNSGESEAQPSVCEIPSSKRKNHQSISKTSYYINGVPASDPSVTKFLSELFSKGYQTTNKVPTSGDFLFASEPTEPNPTDSSNTSTTFQPDNQSSEVTTHSTHPRQFTQIYIPKGQTAVMTQPSDYNIKGATSGTSDQIRAPHIVFHNNIENHGHLVLNQGRGQSPNAHGEGLLDATHTEDVGQRTSGAFTDKPPKQVLENEQEGQNRQPTDGNQAPMKTNDECFTDPNYQTNQTTNFGSENLTPVLN